MTYCNNCEKDTLSTEDKFKDAVFAADGEYLTVYVYSCAECKEHKNGEDWVD